MGCISQGVSLLFVVILAFSSLMITESVDAQQSGTPVGGIISVDTIWTPTGNPYFLVDNITVSKGVTLTIMPGTIIDLKLANLIIDGTLIAKGDDANWIIIQAQKRTTFSWPPRIYFNSSSTQWDENTGTGSIIDHAQISIPNYQYETIIGDYPKISNNIIYNYGSDAAAIRTYGLVYNNTILGGYRGIVAQYNQTIQSNTIKNADVGISCGYMSLDPIYRPTIIGNLLINNTVGIDDSGSNPYITNNTIANSKRGIFLTSYAFYREAAPTAIMLNNIYANELNVYVEAKNSSKIVTMANNWWGTADLTEITRLVYDYRNDSGLARVYCTPHLNASNPMAPSSTEINPNPYPSPTPSPTPTPSPSPIPTPSTHPTPSPTPVSTPSQTPTTTPSPTPASTSTPTPSPSQTPTTTPSPTPTPQKNSPSLDLTCKSTTLYTNFRVDIKGSLTIQGDPIVDAQIFLSYSVNDGSSWIDLTTVHTDDNGAFLATWAPQVTGEYLLRATSKESTIYSNAYQIISFAILPIQQQNVFSVESNSTITALNFNATTNQFSFAVYGPIGTAGYVRATISKTIMPNSDNIKVYLDGNLIIHTVTSEGDAWIVAFTYHHSTHQVTINQETANSISHSDSYLMYILVGTVLALIALIAMIIWLRKRST